MSRIDARTTFCHDERLICDSPQHPQFSGLLGAAHTRMVSLFALCVRRLGSSSGLSPSRSFRGPRCARSAPLLSSAGTRSATTAHWQIAKLPKTCRYSIALAPSAKCEAPMLTGGSSAVQDFIVLLASAERLFVQSGGKTRRSPHSRPVTM